MQDLTNNIVRTLAGLERGDTFEAQVILPGGTETVWQFEITRTRDIGDRNGFMCVKRTNANVPNNTHRLYVTDDGVSVAKGWSPSERMIENISLELDTFPTKSYEIEVSRDVEGNITESHLVEVTPAQPTGR